MGAYAQETRFFVKGNDRKEDGVAAMSSSKIRTK